MQKILRDRDGREWREFYLQCESIGIAVAAELPAAPLTPVASVGHREDRGVTTHPWAWGTQEEQDEGSWHEELHLVLCFCWRRAGVWTGEFIPSQGCLPFPSSPLTNTTGTMVSTQAVAQHLLTCSQCPWGDPLGVQQLTCSRSCGHRCIHHHWRAMGNTSVLPTVEV